MSDTYYRITHGLPFVAMLEHHAGVTKGHAAVDEIAVRYGAEMGKNVMWGTRVHGLKFNGDPGKLWKPVSGAPGYYSPDKRKKAGKEIAAALDVIRIPSQQDLAVSLGCPAFFMMCGQHYCSAVGYAHVAGVFYVNAPIPLRPRLDEGICPIPASEYHAAIEGATP